MKDLNRFPACLQVWGNQTSGVYYSNESNYTDQSDYDYFTNSYNEYAGSNSVGRLVIVNSQEELDAILDRE